MLALLLINRMMLTIPMQMERKHLLLHTKWLDFLDHNGESTDKIISEAIVIT